MQFESRRVEAGRCRRPGSVLAEGCLSPIYLCAAVRFAMVRSRRVGRLLGRVEAAMAEAEGQ